MEQPRSGPPPIPLRVDLGETEESVLESQKDPAANNLPSIDTIVPEMAIPQPTPQDDKPVQKPSLSTLPNASKPIPAVNLAKPAVKKNAKGRPTISIISSRPMDEGSTSASVHFKNDKSGDSAAQDSNAHINNNQQSTTGTSSNPERPSGPIKPGRPAPLAPTKPHLQPEDKNSKRSDGSRSKAPVPNRRSKTKSPKGDSGSVFYIDTSADVDKTPSAKPKLNDAGEAVPKTNTKSKPSLPAPRKPKTKNEPKASEIDPSVNAKVKPPDKAVSKPNDAGVGESVSKPNTKSKPSLLATSKTKTKNEPKASEVDPAVNAKPKLKPTIITAKTPKQAVGGKTHEAIIPPPENTSNIAKETEGELPIRPSFPPSADAEELNRNESQPERPKAPPNTIKDEQRDVEKKKETKKFFKREPTNKKQPKSKPVRPPMAKESARPKPSRPPPAKPNVKRKSPPKVNDVASKERAKSDKSASVKPSGPPRAQAKFDYAGETDDDLTFKAGDTIMLTSKVDDDWFVGYLENNVMHQGLFPTSFVEIIVALKEQPAEEENNPSAFPSEPYAVACHDFQAQGQGELSFVSGQIIILLERINAEWLKGKVNNSVGIFPANFVKIERDLPLTTNTNDVVTPAPTRNTGNSVNEEWCRAIHDYQGEHKDDLSFVTGTEIKIIERIDNDWFKGEYSGNSGIFPASFVEILPATDKGSQDVKLVTATHDYPGASADDLSFKTGDKIKVIERINADWFMGEFGGKQGLFPASFVEGENSSVQQDPDKVKEQTKDKRMGKAIHEFTGENPGELHFGVGDAIEVLRQIDDNWSEGVINDVTGIFPTAFIEIQASKSKEAYAKALYDFAGESEHDLSFKTGDVIQNLEHVNDEWCTGSIGGRTGHFPSSFVEIFASR
ncbi:SH3 domain-containing protein 19-like isoform X2 [Dendronephthya gigantea]|uniref:SH3 domain-containing protein 19-like isoform X2 n=1 Tax=Dendronephthya gigantea TaxID=151771 RepID=UPI00106D7398|nr:SH3 domain-containing protein 19-like isoform X2 [Dendronephthya gigantea]